MRIVQIGLTIVLLLIVSASMVRAQSGPPLPLSTSSLLSFRGVRPFSAGATAQMNRAACVQYLPKYIAGEAVPAEIKHMLDSAYGQLLSPLQNVHRFAAMPHRLQRGLAADSIVEVDTAIVYADSAYGVPPDTLRQIYEYDSHMRTAVRTGQVLTDGAFVNTVRTIWYYNETGNPDSTVEQRWYVSAWGNGYHQYYTYTPGGQVSTELDQEWVDGVWNTTFLTAYTYDAYGDLLLQFSQAGTTGGLVDYQSEAWTYDASHRELSDILSDYYSVNTWAKVYGYEYAYSADGNTVTRTYQLRLDQNPYAPLKNWENEISTHDSTGEIIRYQLQYWEDSVWVNTLLDSTIYDSTGRKLEDSTFIPGGRGWVIFTDSSWTYNAAGKVISVHVEYYNGFQWDPTYFDTLTYDANGHLISTLWQEANNIDPQLPTNLYLWSYTNDADGNQTSGAFFTWQNEAWTPLNGDFTINLSAADTAVFPCYRFVLTRSPMGTYAIETSAGAGGTVTPWPVLQVQSGANAVYEVTPNPGYTIDSIFVDGQYTGNTSPDTIWNVTGFHDVTATFKVHHTTVTWNCVDGWNLVSFPFVDTLGGRVAIFPNALTPLYGYADGYVAANVLTPGAGYWIKVLGSESKSFTAIPDLPDSVTVTAGWNLIGAGGYPVPANAIQAIGTTLQSVVWGYDKGYTQADTIVPGKAYWVEASGAGKLLFTLTQSSKTSAHMVDPLAKFSKLTIRDASGAKQVLYAGDQPIDLSKFAMPPAPPAGVFDARFASGRMAEKFVSGTSAGRSFTVNLSSVKLPLTVTLDAAIGERAQFTISDGVDGAMFKSVALHSGRSVSINAGQIKSFTIGVAPLPAEFALTQNFPNPFNPTTEIRYALPEAAQVSLVVYNTLGQEVRVLVNAYQPAGYQSVRFDASALPSGVYFCKLTAGAFSDVKKAILLK